MNYEQLIQVSKQRKTLEVQVKKMKSDFEDSIALHKAQLDDLNAQENTLREEALLTLEKEDKISEKVGDKVVSRQVKKTLKISDPYLLEKAIEKIKVDDYGFRTETVKEAFDTEVIIKNKPIINSLIDAYEKVEGKNLSGVEEQLTKYLMIK